MGIINYIIWAPNPEIFPNLDWGIIGNIRWYGLLFAMAFIIGQQIMIYMFNKENKPQRDIETLTIFMVVATVIGARLGHVLFYEPARFLSNPVEIFMIQKGGLASHGAAFGILFGIWIYVNYYIRIGFSKPYFVWKKRKREGQNYLWVVDRIVIVVALAGCFIRMGNFINSEIIGKPTDSSMAVLFARDIIDRFEYDRVVDKVEVRKALPDDGTNPIKITFLFNNDNFNEAQIRAYLENNVKRIMTDYEYVAMHVNEPRESRLDYTLEKVDDQTFFATVNTHGIPRHPAQLYESFTSLLLFVLLLGIWFKLKEKTPNGRLLGLFLIILFGLRFVHELFKENQVDFEATIPLNMGQWLSIPLIIAGILILLRSYRPNSQP